MIARGKQVGRVGMSSLPTLILYEFVTCHLLLLTLFRIIYNTMLKLLRIHASLFQPTIDDHSADTLAVECPRILVNPKPLPFGFQGVNVPREAFLDVALDDPVVKDVDPKTWAVRGIAPKIVGPSSDSFDLPMAERFRLAFMERDARLAPKRAKNARQHKRRAEREWMMMSTDAKSIALASQANKFLHNRT